MSCTGSRKPLITVIIPVYNSADFLAAALQSVLDQTYENIEIILVDDGSDDGSIETVDGVQDGRVRVIRKRNGGRASALNRALDCAEGDFFCIQDSDDLSYPHRLGTLLAEALRHPHAAAVFSGYDILVEGNRIAPVLNAKCAAKCRQEVAVLRMPSHDATPLYRRSLVQNMRFDERFRIGSGMDFVLRVGERYPLVSVGHCLYTYRVHCGSTTRANSLRRRQMVEQVFVVT